MPAFRIAPLQIATSPSSTLLQMAFNLPASRAPRNTMHPGPASRPAGGCMRESAETTYQVVASQLRTAEFRGSTRRLRVQPPRSIERGSGESPEKKRSTTSAAGTLGLRGRCRPGLPWGSPMPRAAVRSHRQPARESGPAASRGYSGGQRALPCADRLSDRQADSTGQPLQSETGPRQRESLASPSFNGFTGERTHATPSGSSATHQ